MRSIRTALFLLGGVVLTLASCKKTEGDLLGGEVLPESDLLNVVKTDTTKIIAYSVPEDSLRTDELAANLLGEYRDPLFGLVRATPYFQIRLGTFNPNFGNPSDLAIDSVVLSMVYTPGGEYGALDPQRFNVYELTQPIALDSVYFTSSSVSMGSVDLVKPGFNVITPNVTDSVALISNASIQAPQMRIRLDESFGWRFLNEPADGNLLDDDAFQNFFNGLAIVPDGGNPPSGYGGILSLDLEDIRSKVTIFYRNTLVGMEDTLTYDFLISNRSARAHKIDIDITGSAVEAQYSDTTLGEGVVYMQSIGGPKVFLQFPELENLLDSGDVSINRAELIIPIADSLVENYFPHARFFALAVPEDGVGPGTFTQDLFEGDTHVDGFWDPTVNVYRLKITRHVQQILSGAIKNTGLFLIPGEASTSPNRTPLIGPGAIGKKLKLELTFTKL